MMPSPFPGMAPYLERHWGDVRTSLMVYARNQLNPQLPDDLQALVQESLTVQIDGDKTRDIYPDVRIVEDVEAPWSDAAPAAVAPLAEPLLKVDESRVERHLEIVDTSEGDRPITAIEVPSPANKVGADGRAAYHKKQREYLDSGVNLVEIDLLRQGEFVLAVPEHMIKPKYRTPYRVCIRRSRAPGMAEFYRAALREPLPNIPIPLRPTDREVVLQLQPLINDCYRDGK